MTLDEAIKKCESFAEICKEDAEFFTYSGETWEAHEHIEGAKELFQIAEWLKELKDMKARL